MSWREFWDGDHSIYVSDRHRMLHYDRIAKDIAAYVPNAQAQVLDHGCGEAASADLIAARCGALHLYDQAPSVQEKLRLKFSRNPKITVLASEALDLLPNALLDLIVANSLLQYLPYAGFESLLEFWRGKIKPDGLLVLADLIPPDLGAVTDAKALLHFGWQGGFFIPAIVGLARTAFSSYRELRQEIGLTQYPEEDVQTLLAAHGFRGERAPKNIGHNQARFAMLARLK